LGWRNQLPKEGSKPEENLWSILSEMGVAWEPNVMLEDGFTAYGRHVDVLVEGVLGIEVQSSFHTKSLRERKDVAKRRSIEASGLAWMELWEDELEKATQVKAGAEWRPLIKEWIHGMLPYAHRVHNEYVEYQSRLPEPPLLWVPGQGMMRLDERRQ